MKNLPNALASLLNKYSMENESNTPDFILAHYMLACLKAFDLATKARTNWYECNCPANITTTNITRDKP